MKTTETINTQRLTSQSLPADFAGKQRAAFEKYNVFSPAMIDGITTKLRAYGDRDSCSWRRMSGEMLKLVEKYFHCG